jgi:hypothetical protein
VAINALPKVKVVVPDMLENPHDLVARAAEILAKAQLMDGILSEPPDRCLDIRVSPGSLDRALRIANALIEALETQGLALQVDILSPERHEPEPAQHDAEVWNLIVLPDRAATRVQCDGEWLELDLCEESDRVEDAKSDPARRRLGGDTWRTESPPTYHLEPNGRLRLSLTNVYHLKIRRSWGDGERQRLETCLPAFIAHLRVAAAAMRLWREKDERRRSRAEAEAELRRVEAEEKMREERLLALVAQWRTAADVRSYVEEAARVVDSSEAAEQRKVELRRELDWARLYADRIDPVNSLRSHLHVVVRADHEDGLSE